MKNVERVSVLKNKLPLYGNNTLNTSVFFVRDTLVFLNSFLILQVCLKKKESASFL